MTFVCLVERLKFVLKDKEIETARRTTEQHTWLPDIVLGMCCGCLWVLSMLDLRLARLLVMSVCAIHDTHTNNK